MATSTSTMTAEDRLGVMDLFADYCAAIDGGDLDAYVDNFLPDAVMEYDGTTTYNGREAIREFVGGLFAGGRVGAEPAFIRHFVGLPHIWGDGERAHARTYVIIFTQDKDRNVAVPSVGSYTDTCVKVDGRWMFEKRVIYSDLGSFTASRDKS